MVLMLSFVQGLAIYRYKSWPFNRSKCFNKSNKEKLIQKNEKGKIVLIIRMGAAMINKLYPKILRTVSQAKLNVVWSCDPMHANTEKAKSGFKTRVFKKFCLR